MYWLAKLPIITTLFSIYFTWEIGRHWWKKKHAMYLLWWCIGVFFYGAGTFVESWVGLFGWEEPIFRLWYIFDASLPSADCSLVLAVVLPKLRIPRCSMFWNSSDCFSSTGLYGNQKGRVAVLA